MGFGVLTAYRETITALQRYGGGALIDVRADSKQPADIVHIHTIKFDALRELLFGRDKRKIISAHVTPSSLVGAFAGSRLWLPLARRYLRFLFNHADTVIAVSDATREELLKMGVWRPIVVLYDTIDTRLYSTTKREKQDLRIELGISEQKFVVVGNGQINQRKHFDTFYEIAGKMPEVEFIWIGGISFKAISENARTLQYLIDHAPANLRVTGSVPHDTAVDYMRAADAMFFPSRQETFGLAIIEGAAAGLPVVVRDIHDYDKTFGELVIRGKTLADFENIIKKLVHDEAFYATWRANSHKLAAKYDSSIGGKDLIELYRKVWRMTR